MGIDRERKPRHAGFHRKEKPVRTRTPAAVKPAPAHFRPDNHVVPSEGPIRIFFDDEREMPAGFVIARTVPEFRRLMESIELDRLHTVCFDWHLGTAFQSRPGETGHDAVAILVDMINAEPTRFSGLSSIWFHSTKLEEAIEMRRKMDRCLYGADKNGMFEEVYTLPDTYSPNVGI